MFTAVRLLAWAAVTICPRGALSTGSSLEALGFESEVPIGPDVSLHFTMHDSTIKLAVDVPGTGWASLGIGSTMADSDAVIGGGLKGAGGTASDVRAYTLSAKTGSGVNENAAATAQLTDVQVLHEGGRTKVIYTRPLDNGFKAIASSGQTAIIWAYGSGHSIGYHGSNKGAGSIDFSTSAVNEDTTERDKKVVHGVFMILGWGVCIPLGTIAAAWAGPRFGGRAAPFNVHRGLQSVGLLLATLGAVYAMTAIYSSHLPRHGIAGLVISLLGALQPVNALLRPHDDGNLRAVWQLVHKNLGRVATLLGLLNCIFGSLLALKQHEGEGAFDGLLNVSLTLLVLSVVGYLAAICRRCWRATCTEETLPGEAAAAEPILKGSLEAA